MIANIRCQIWDSRVLHVAHQSKWDSQLTWNTSAYRLWTHHEGKTSDAHVYPSGGETSVAQLWCTVAGIQASRPIICMGVGKWMETLFVSWILELLIYIVRQKVIFFPFQCIGTALSIFLYISTRDSPYARLIQSFFYRQLHILLFIQ